jgi:peptide/nickel transport system substrate-binding protein
MIYDTLFGSDEKGNIRPQMVDKYSVSKDSLVWTFTLRPGLKFSDGSPVTSDDVIASLNRWGKRDVLGQKMYAAMESLTPQGRVSWLPNLQATYGFGATWPKQMSQSYCKAEVPTAKSSA